MQASRETRMIHGCQMYMHSLLVVDLGYIRPFGGKCMNEADCGASSVACSKLSETNV